MSHLSVSQCYCFDGHLAGGHCCQRSGSFGTSLATAPGRFSVFALPSHIGYSDSIGANEVICVCSFFSDRYCDLPRQLTCKTWKLFYLLTAYFDWCPCAPAAQTSSLFLSSLMWTCACFSCRVLQVPPCNPSGSTADSKLLPCYIVCGLHSFP